LSIIVDELYTKFIFKFVVQVVPNDFPRILRSLVAYILLISIKEGATIADSIFLGVKVKIIFAF